MFPLPDLLEERPPHQVLRIEMRDACGDEILISGLADFVEIAIPLQVRLRVRS